MYRTKLPPEKQRLFGENEVKHKVPPGLRRRFSWPPFTVLRTSDGEWQKRKRQWLSLGIQSEVGRGESLAYSGEPIKDYDLYRHKEGTKKVDGLTFRSTGFMADIIQKRGGGTSIFDPALCELMYQWFCPPGGQVVDPFAGGSVRGIVANFMGYDYWGCELRPEQVEANRVQAEKIVPDNQPTWVCGDAWYALKQAPEADFVFSCPPYGDLEVYSELEGDISNVRSYDEFLEMYQNIIRRACSRLRRNRFACFVVANYRDKHGFYHDFVGDTVRAFEAARARFYNDVILATAIGSLPVRAGRAFASTRKMGKAHQNVLIFYKGKNPKDIKGLFPAEGKAKEGTK